MTEVTEAKAQRSIEVVRLEQPCPIEVSCKPQMSFKISSSHTKKVKKQVKLVFYLS